MMLSFLFCNCFVRSFIIGVRLVFIGVGKSIGLLGLNLKRVKTGMVFVDEYYEML